MTIGIFDRYVFKNITIAFVIALLFLLLCDALVEFVGEVEKVNADYRLALMFAAMLADVPQKIHLFAPAAMLIATMMGLGNLAAAGELSAAQLSGRTPLRLVAGGMMLAFVVGVMLIVFSEYILPHSNKFSATLRGAPQQNNHNFWLRDAQTIARIGKLQADGSISDITLLQTQKDRLQLTHARRARFVNGSWQILEATTFVFGKDAISVKNAPQFWHNNITPRTLQTLWYADDSQESISKLFVKTQFLRNNGLHYRHESLQLWQRLLSPLALLTMLLLALPFVFGYQRDGGQGKRLLLGTLLGVSYYLVAGMLANISLIFSWNGFWGALLPILTFAMTPIYWLLHR